MPSLLRCGVAALVLAGALAPLPAAALQPLGTFVDAARTYHPSNAEALAALDAQEAQADVNLGRALPGVGARGVYTRNQIQVAIPGAVIAGFFGETLPPGAPPPPPAYIQRYNGLDAFLTLNVPLVDLASWGRVQASRTGADAAQQQVRATALQVESQVVQTYYQLVAYQALVAASQRALDVAKTNLKLTQDRFDAGRAASLDVERAKADMERQDQQLVAAQLQVALAARALESATGLAPDMTSEVSLADDLHEEAGLETFQSPDDAIPQVAAAVTNRVASEQQARSQRFTLLPALGGSLLEHGTNTPSFIGADWAYSASLTLSWQLDYSSFALIRAQQANATAAEAREREVKLAVRDAIHRAWATVGASIARGRSARAEQEAAAHASKLAQDRYEAGATTQLDLLQAQRDAFSADVARIQADADLANARLQLRLAAGIDPLQPKGTP